MIINGKEYDFDKMFKKMKIYCTKNDIVYSYEINGKITIRPSEHLRLILKSNKININNFRNNVNEKLRFSRYCISNIYLANIINDVLNEMIKENNRMLEIE